MGTSSTVSRHVLPGNGLNSNSDLPAAIRQSESLRKGQKIWPPTDAEEDLSGKGLVGVMDDELGFVD